MVQTWKEMGFKSLDDFLVNFWEKFFLARDANNLLCMLSTWTNGNIGDTEGFNGGVEEALASIQVGGISWLHACMLAFREGPDLLHLPVNQHAMAGKKSSREPLLN